MFYRGEVAEEIACRGANVEKDELNQTNEE
jgi:hypothetical protein